MTSNVIFLLFRPLLCMPLIYLVGIMAILWALIVSNEARNLDIAIGILLIGLVPLALAQLTFMFSQIIRELLVFILASGSNQNRQTRSPKIYVANNDYDFEILSLIWCKLIRVIRLNDFCPKVI